VDQDKALLLITKALVKFLGENDGVIVEHEGVKYAVVLCESQVIIRLAPKETTEGNRISYFEDIGEAVTKAALDPNGVFIDESAVDVQDLVCDFYEDGMCTNPEIEASEVSAEVCKSCEANTKGIV
jgi:hypothetical protein